MSRVKNMVTVTLNVPRFPVATRSPNPIPQPDQEAEMEHEEAQNGPDDSVSVLDSASSTGSGSRRPIISPPRALPSESSGSSSSSSSGSEPDTSGPINPLPEQRKEGSAAKVRDMTAKAIRGKQSVKKGKPTASKMKALGVKTGRIVKKKESLTFKPPPLKHGKKYPSGSVSLMATTREEGDICPDDPKDADYRPSKNVVVDASSSKPETRRDLQFFAKISDSLPDKSDQIHDPNEESSDFEIFVSKLKKQNVKITEVDSYEIFENEKCCWVTTCCRYRNRNQRTGSIMGGEDKTFWQKKNGSPVCLSKLLLKLMEVRRTKIAIIVGWKSQKSMAGHAVTLVLVPEPDGEWKAVIKDSSSHGIAAVSEVMYDLLNRSKFKFCYIVGAIDQEHHVLGPQCLRMAYKVIGEVFEGTSFLERDCTMYTSKWDLKAKKKLND